MSDPWAVLGVSADASDDDIQAAYRRLAARHHPDRPGGDARRMAEINAAYTAARRRGRDPEQPGASPTAARPQPVVEAAGSGRPLGCAMVAAIALVVVAATIAVAVIVASRPSSRAGSGTADRTAGESRSTTTLPSDVKPPPWEDGRLPASSSPLAASVWQRSPAAAACPLLVPAGADREGTARVVDVPGGWGVAWGLENQPDLFGIIARPRSPGNGGGEVVASLSWTDGSRALLYVDGSRIVADLAVEGVRCFYEVYSAGGFDNLTQVLGALQFVDV